MSSPPTDDFPVFRLRRGVQQTVSLGGLYENGELVPIIVNGCQISKNFGPAYEKDATRPENVTQLHGPISLTLDEFDTDTPGVLNVLLRVWDQYLQYWFFIDE